MGVVPSRRRRLLTRLPTSPRAGARNRGTATSTGRCAPASHAGAPVITAATSPRRRPSSHRRHLPTQVRAIAAVATRGEVHTKRIDTISGDTVSGGGEGGGEKSVGKGSSETNELADQHVAVATQVTDRLPRPTPSHHLSPPLIPSHILPHPPTTSTTSHHVPPPPPPLTTSHHLHHLHHLPPHPTPSRNLPQPPTTPTTLHTPSRHLRASLPLSPHTLPTTSHYLRLMSIFPQSQADLHLLTISGRSPHNLRHLSQADVHLPTISGRSPHNRRHVSQAVLHLSIISGRSRSPRNLRPISPQSSCADCSRCVPSRATR